MTEKQKEKQVLQLVKEKSRLTGWKFKGYFTHKVSAGFFYACYFYAEFENDQMFISATLEMKPALIDDVFWTVIGERNNIKRPLSFRAEAAFKVPLFPVKTIKLTVQKPEDHAAEIQSLIDQMNDYVAKNTPGEEDYMQLLLADEDKHAAAVLTMLISRKEYAHVIQKATDYKERNVHSLFTFGKEDYFGFARHYCLEKLNGTGTALLFIRRWLQKLFIFN